MMRDSKEEYEKDRTQDTGNRTQDTGHEVHFHLMRWAINSILSP